MHVIRLLLRKAPLQLLAATAAGALAGVIAGSLIAILRDAAATGDASFRRTALFAALCVALVALQVLSRVEESRLLHHRVIPSFRRSLAGTVIAGSLKRVEALGPGRLIGAMTGHAADIAFASSAWLRGARSIAAICATVIYLLVLAPSLFPVVIASVAAALVMFRVLSSAGDRAAARANRAKEAAYADVRMVATAIKELKIVARRREAFLEQSLEPHVREVQREGVRAAALGALSTAWSSIALLGALGVLLYVWPGSSAAPELLAAYAFAFVFLQGEFAAVLSVVTTVRDGEAALRSANELRLDPEPTIAATPRSSFARIDVRGVTHAYRREDADIDFTLGPIDLTIRPGELVFIVGGNGSGKTTLAKLLLGLYPPESGDIAVDDDVVTAERIPDYRALFSAILSDWHVFDRLYGLRGEDLDARANALLAKLRLDRKVTVRDGAFSTVDLSQGQRKRLALVTAYLEDRPICLFDEWASDQDPVFKEVFYRELLPELRARGRTALVITHDDAYFDVADRVVRLEDGRIAEAG